MCSDKQAVEKMTEVDSVATGLKHKYVYGLS
jgi:hypothetical protein